MQDTARRSNKLTAVALRNPAPGRHWDGGGLYLEVTEQGARYWRLKYRQGGKEKRLALGVYPEVSLSEARTRRDDARALMRSGIDPAEKRKADRVESRRSERGSFGEVCAEWLAFKAAGWSSESTRKAEYVLRAYLLPALKSQSIGELSTKDAARALLSIADTAPDLARKARQYLQGIVSFAIRQGLRDEGRGLLLNDVLPRVRSGHIPAQTMPDEIRALMRAVRVYQSEVTRCALLVCAYTAQRPGMVAAMRWDEIARDRAEWCIPGEKMKTRHAHIVPLQRQVLALLDDVRKYSAGLEYVFPPLARQRTPHLHRDALSKALRVMGFGGQHATHGFRGMLRTAGRERLGIPADVLEAQLAHAKRGNVQKAYDRTTFDQARIEAMQRWADWLDDQAA